jgi:hypothetical protein
MSKKIYIDRRTTPKGGKSNLNLDNSVELGTWVTNHLTENPLPSTAVTSPYKVYTASMFQVGTAAPVATVHENTLGGDIVWRRDNLGDYYGLLTGAFTVNKTWIVGQNQNFNQNVLSYFNSVDEIGLVTEAGTDGNVAYDIEIRVYN